MDNHHKQALLNITQYIVLQLFAWFIFCYLLTYFFACYSPSFAFLNHLDFLFK